MIDAEVIMAKDDMDEIIYKVLKYIQACDKGRETFDENRIHPGSDLIPDVPYSYWARIMSELEAGGYLTDVLVRYTKDEAPYVTMCEPHITLAGEQFLHENSLMKKVGETFKNAMGVLSFLKP